MKKPKPKVKKKATKGKFKKICVLGGDEAAQISTNINKLSVTSGKKFILLGTNSITPAQARRLSAWLVQAAEVVEKEKGK